MTTKKRQWKHKQLLVVVPAYNEETVISATLQGLLARLTKLAQKTGIKINVAVIDDGSSDKTLSVVKKFPVIVLEHVINRGLGGALGTGFELAREMQPDVLVTFDADGQHNPDDIETLIKPILDRDLDVVVGSRLLAKKQMRFDRWVLNKAANILTILMFGFKTTDSQSGLRAFSPHAIEHIYIKTERMEVSTEFFMHIREFKLSYSEIPIDPIYTEYSLAKGQDQVGNLNAINVLTKLILRLVR